MAIVGIDARAPDTARSRTLAFLLVGLLALCAASMLYGGWLSDDYLIGLRQSLNLIHGRGFSFFSESRVQTMTSPLWGIVLAPVVGVLDVFYAPILLSIALSLAAVVMLTRYFWRDAAARVPLLVALTFLTWSRAFIDFSSSGLENPLAYVWASWFLIAWLRGANTLRQRDLVQLFASAALLVLTRYDYAVLVAPSLAWAAWLSRRTKGLWVAALIFAGIVLPWLAFALVYYGTVLPNAFYAKLTTGIPGNELAAFGLQYIVALIQYDPASVLMLMLAIGLTLWSDDRARWLHMLVGIGAYLAYAVLAGGDFMVGRFVSVPLVLCSGLICRSLVLMSGRNTMRPVMVGLVVCLLATAPQLPILNNYFSAKAMKVAGKKTEVVARINDEKNAYLAQRGLFSGHERFASWLAGKAEKWREPRRESAQRVIRIDCGGLGWLGFEYGPDAAVYDSCALADPFISKLPLFEVGAPRRRLPWGPGHFTRALPEGYQESLAGGRNAISDPVLADVYQSMALVTAGALFDARRWQAIYDLATLKLVQKAQSARTYDEVLHARPQRTYSAPYSEFSRLFRAACTSVERAQELEPADVIDLTFERPTQAHRLRLSGTIHQPMDIRFSLGHQDVGRISVTPKPVCEFGLGVVESGLPPTARGGFDRIRISSAGGKASSIGGFLLQDIGVSPPLVRKGETVLDLPACRLLHNRGVATARCSVHAAAGAKELGHLMFGPYVPLGPGSYIFEIDYSVGAARGTRAGQWDIVANYGRGEGVILARGDVPGTENVPTTYVGNFWIGSEGTNPAIEVRMWPGAALEAEAFALRIYRAEPRAAGE